MSCRETPSLRKPRLDAKVEHERRAGCKVSTRVAMSWNGSRSGCRITTAFRSTDLDDPARACGPSGICLKAAKHSISPEVITMPDR